MRKLVIDKKYNNTSLSKVIYKEFPNFSKNSLYKLFRIKDIKLNGKRIKEDVNVFENDVIEIYAEDNALLGIPKHIDYYYEDDNILVAYKPKGISSTGDNNSFDVFVIQDRISNGNNCGTSNDENIKICHRLDTNTEGLVLFSKNNLAHDEILNGFKNGKIHKKYITFVTGKMPKDHDVLSGYILKDSKTRLL